MMMASTGYVLAAGAISAANEALFTPLITGQAPWKSLNWKIIPATGVMALVLAGVEKLAPKFGAGLGALVLLSVLVIQTGNAPSPLSNIATILGYTKKVAL
jgi:hypothetical protein